MNNFYVTIDSSASPKYFDKNKISDFRNKLNTPIKLEHEQWEVALVECSYVHSNLIIVKNEFLLKGKTVQKKEKAQFDYFKLKSKRDIYNTTDLIQELNENEHIVKYKIDEEGYINIVYPTDINISLEYSEKLGGILGLEDCTLKSTNYVGEVEAEKSNGEKYTIVHYKFNEKLHLSAGQMRMFVYCDIIKPQYVADTMAPLLRSFMYSGRFHGEQITKTFDHVQYMDIKYPEFEMIHIWLKTESGEPVLFETGSFAATLHFRRKSVY